MVAHGFSLRTGFGSRAALAVQDRSAKGGAVEERDSSNGDGGGNERGNDGLHVEFSNVSPSQGLFLEA
jgi:hypothetical protein